MGDEGGIAGKLDLASASRLHCVTVAARAVPPPAGIVIATYRA